MQVSCGRSNLAKRRRLLVPVLLALGQVSACSLCSNEVSKEIPSPNGGFKVVVFQRDCGATTGFSTQISILASTDSPRNSLGNVFTADDNRGAAPVDSQGRLRVSIRWASTNRVIIEYPKGSRVFKHEDHWKNIVISYLEILSDR